MNHCTLCSGPIRGGYAISDDNKPAHAICLKSNRRQSRPVDGLDESQLEPLSADDHAALATRPKTWGECRDGVGPCVWVSCRYHLGIDVTEHGRLVLVHPDPTEMAEPCALRLAERGDSTGADVAKRLGITRQRVEQLTNRALRVLRMAGVQR